MRRETIAAIVILCIFAAFAFAGSTTTNLSLYKPTIGEVNWGALVNANWDTLDDAHVTPKPSGVEFYVAGEAGISSDLTIGGDLTVEGDDFGINLAEITAPTLAPANTAYIFLDSGNDLKVQFDSGSPVTLGSHP